MTQSHSRKKLGVLISGGGTNLQAIIDACESGILKDKAEVAVVISDKSDAYGLERARRQGIPAKHFSSKDFADNNAFCEKISEKLAAHKVDIVCLAGFMRMIAPCLVEQYKNRMLNIHPALLPKHGGKGMYGHHVHRAVIASKDIESGATVHLVDDEYDHGQILLQRSVPVLPKDTPEELAKRVLAVEHEIYPEAIRIVIDNLSHTKIRRHV